MTARQYFTAWMTTWAVITFASAAVETGVSGPANPLDYAGRVFAVADAVPPLAKLALGALLALAVYAASKTYAVLVLAATPFVFFVCLCVLPFGYYEPFSTSAFFPGHLLAALVGSLIPFVWLAKRSNRRRVKENSPTGTCDDKIGSALLLP